MFLVQTGDWASPEATKRSFELFSEQVIPHFNGSLQRRLDAYDWVLQTSALGREQFVEAQQKARDAHDAERRAGGST